MFAMGGPVRMEEGGTPTGPGGIIAAAQAMGISVEELMEKIRQAEQRAFADRALRNSPRISTSDFERMKEMMPRQEGMRGIPRDTFDKLSPEDQNKVLGKKSFVESQPEGSLKGTFFDYIPDAYQMSDYLRQFFTKEPKGMAAGGAAFPDLTGDGQVTQADILKGRGVQLAMGGEPMMAQQAAMMQAPMPQAPMPQDPSMDQAMAQAAQVGVDPAAVEGMLSQVSEGIGNLDEAEDFEQVMNSMRGDEAPISERYAELAEVVGEEDAQATPESVLALVQPVMQIAQVDQGIGGLAQEEMSAPVEGNMAGGIMSTVNMGEEVPAPVNFNQGGPVVAMQQGGEGRLAKLFQEQKDVYGTLLDPASTQQAFDEQKKLTQAQMLFDIANTALAFASPGERQMSPAERLASVTQETQLFDKIGARAQGLQDLKTKQAGEKRAMDLAALQAASGLYSAERSAELAEEAAEKARLAGDVGDIYKVTITKPDGTTETMERPVTLGQYNDYIEEYGENNVSFSLVPKKTTAQGAENFLVNGQLRSAIKGTPEHTLYASTGVRVGNLEPGTIIKKKQVTLLTDIKIGDKTYKAGTSPNLSELQLADLPPDSFTEFQKPITDKDVFTKFGMTKEGWNSLSDEDRQVLLGLPVVTTVQYFNKFGMEKDAFMALPEKTRAKLLGLSPEYTFTTVDGVLLAVNKDDPNKKVTVHTSDKLDLRTVNGVIVGVDRKGKATELYGEQDKIAPDYRVITRENVETIVDINTTAGQAAIALASSDNAAAGATVAEVRKIPAASRPTAKAFAVKGVGTVLSYDGGRTYTDGDGQSKPIPNGATPLSDTIAYNVAAQERIKTLAGNQLAEFDDQMISNVTQSGTAENPTNLTQQENYLVRNAMDAARNGTGPYAGFAVFLDRTFAGALPIAREFFQATQANKQFLRGVTILGRSALVVNPRFPVAELERVGALFPDPDAFFTNPESEAQKLVELKTLALSQKRANLAQLASGIPDDTTRQQVLSNNFEIERLLGLLQAVPTSTQSGLDSDTLNSLRKQLQGE